MKLSLTKFCLVAAAVATVVPTVAGPMRMAEKNVTPMAPAPECTWSGFYIGLNAGATELQSRFTDLNYYSSGDTATYEQPGFIGGGQVGYNYQWQQLVFGIEGDASGIAGAENNGDRFYGYNGGQTRGIRDDAYVDFVATLRLRLGISFNDNKALIYATGGGAYAHGKWDSYFRDYLSSNYEDLDWRGDDWRWGWTGGFGFQYALNCHWSLRAETLYTWLEHDVKPITYTGGRYAGRENDFHWKFEDDLWTFRVGVDYKFGGFFGH